MSKQPVKPADEGPKINTVVVSSHKVKTEDARTWESGNEAFEETETENIKFCKPRRT